jgi:hypothetical protein
MVKKSLINNINNNSHIYKKINNKLQDLYNKFKRRKTISNKEI